MADPPAVHPARRRHQPAAAEGGRPRGRTRWSPATSRPATAGSVSWSASSSARSPGCRRWSPSWPGPRRAQPVDLSLVVDTGLGGVPKALSTALSRSSLLTPRTVETAAPPDVDAIWLERVSEFVPGGRGGRWSSRGGPPTTTRQSTVAWLDAVRRVAEHGCAPKLRAGGPRASDVPPVSDVEDFLRVAVEAGRGFTVFGLRAVVRTESAGLVQHGLLNLLVAVARAVAGARRAGRAAEHRRRRAGGRGQAAVRPQRRRGARAARPLRRRPGAGAPRRSWPTLGLLA